MRLFLQVFYQLEGQTNFFSQSGMQTKMEVPSCRAKIDAQFSKCPRGICPGANWRCCELLEDGREHIDWGQCRQQSLDYLHSPSGNATADLQYRTQRWDVPWDWRRQQSSWALNGFRTTITVPPGSGVVTVDVLSEDDPVLGQHVKLLCPNGPLGYNTGQKGTFKTYTKGSSVSVQRSGESAEGWSRPLIFSCYVELKCSCTKPYIDPQQGLEYCAEETAAPTAKPTEAVDEMEIGDD